MKQNRDAISIVSANCHYCILGVMPRTARFASGGQVYPVLNRSAGRMRMSRKDAFFGRTVPLHGTSVVLLSVAISTFARA
jgi:hypothetical protein